MDFAPDGRLFYTEKNSGLIRVTDRNVVLQKTPFATISDIYVSWEEGLLGITLDDKFTENHFVYAFYNYKDEATGEIHGRSYDLLTKTVSVQTFE